MSKRLKVQWCLKKKCLFWPWPERRDEVIEDRIWAVCTECGKRRVDCGPVFTRQIQWLCMETEDLEGLVTTLKEAR